MPAVESRYRGDERAAGRAIVGLSMGGIQSANIGLTHANLFSYVAIFSSGWFPNERAVFEGLHGPELDADRDLLSLLWIGWGRDDPLVQVNASAMVDLLHSHGLTPQVEVTDGAHDWPTWRRYLATEVPLLFS